MKKLKNSPSIIFFIAVLLAGLLLLGVGLIFMNPEQCPSHYTQEQVDASNCNVGANIGLGLILIAGSLAILIGLIGLAVSVKNLWLKLLLLLVAATGVYWSVASWKQGVDEANRIYCLEKIQKGESIYEGEAFCDKYR